MKLGILEKPIRYILIGFTVCAGTSADSTLFPPDLRVAKLDTFFASYGCPTPHHAVDYIEAADFFQIDYRLLPAISLVESTCGSYAQRNNHWGWDGTRHAFLSVPEGIVFVTGQLAEGQPYRNKALREKLFAYNPLRSYGRKVQRLMMLIETEQFKPGATTTVVAPANTDE